MASSKPGLFAREATGLVREIGFTLGVIIILSHVIGLGWQKRAFQYSGPMPIPNDQMLGGLPAIFWAFLFTGLVVLITGYAVGWVTSTMPRSGGGYVTISRVTHPVIGYMGGWLMFLAEAFSYGLIGVAVFEAIGIFFGIAGAPISWANDPMLLFLGGIVIVWIFAALALLGTKLYGRLMQVIFYIPAIITIIFFAMWIGGAINPGVISDGVTSGMGAPPQTFVNLALQTGMANKIPDFYSAVSYAIPGAFWAYMGWYATTFLAGEVKEANKKLPRVLVVAGLIIIVVYLAASSLSSIAAMNVQQTTYQSNMTDPTTSHTWSFFQSYSWLTYGNVNWTAISYYNATSGITTYYGSTEDWPKGYGEGNWTRVNEVLGTNIKFQPAWSTGIASFASVGMGLGWLALVIAVGAVFWVANDIPPFLLVASRTFFAMSFDRMMPEKFSYVSERWHAPVWAIVITAVLAIPATIAESNVGGLAGYLGFAGVVGTDIFDAFFLTLFSLSAMLLPLERKEIFDRAAVKHKVGSIVTIGALATLGAAFCLFIFIKESVSWIFTPTSTADLASFFGFFGLIGVGLLLYIYYRYRNTTRGIDVRTLFLSIPPE